MNKVKNTKRFGKLVWICNSTGKRVVLHEGEFPLLQHLRSQYRLDPKYAGGRLKIEYLWT